MHQALLYKKLENQNVQCTACNHYCEISPSQTGICGVRQNIDGKLFLLVYGKAVAAHVDPIEKKPLFHFLPNSKIFSIGTIGCNFACTFCQNWDISQATKDIKKKLQKEGNLKDISLKVTNYGYALPPEKIIAYCQTHSIPSIAYTYNEPTVFFEYTLDTAKLAHQAGIKNVYVSNGFASKEAIDKIAPFLDAINIDLKAFTDGFYQKTCKAKLQPVLDNIKYYYEKGIWVEITTLVIPDKNDSEKELTDIAQFIASVSKKIPWHVTRFHPAYKMQNIHTTPEKALQKAYDIGKKAGLKYVYAGNIFNKDLHSTYCPKCNQLVIKRDWGYTEITEMKDGKCRTCQTTIEGVWK